MLEKLNLFCMTSLINSVAIDVKIDGSALEEKSYIKILGCLSLLNWVGALTLSLLLKLPPRKLES